MHESIGWGPVESECDGVTVDVDCTPPEPRHDGSDKLLVDLEEMAAIEHRVRAAGGNTIMVLEAIRLQRFRRGLR